ncbi:cation transport ATPase [Defluviimonas sp. WL0002]|uniref:Cation transport ATPase n=1 Tax=Albidovulum marisflavi TaxID=2984159 RepID=A0ABT2Z9M5_9RHOB|nr:cation transport ATPase [Defluviimonas sp. WL0002]MCV2867849.1 cation transport ATPase [Defluviimonas sp. WL0002]
MSTWISSFPGLRPFLIGAAVLLAAAASAQESAPRKVAVSDGSVVISGPSGYCVDSRSLRDGQDSAFVLLGTCAALNGTGRGPRSRAILTATVLLGAPPGENLKEEFLRMADFFVTEAGRKALSRSGDARSVRVTKIVAAGDVLYILVEDRSPFAGYPVEPEYWRAIFARKGRMISLSVLGLADAPLDQGAKRGLLNKFVSRVEAANS